MKPTLPWLMIAAIAGESVAVSPHELVATQPHIEHECKISMPSTLPSMSASSGGTNSESLGQFRWNTFYRKMLRANRAKERLFAMLDAYVETARAITQRYPDLKIWERQFQYNCFKSQIELTRRRTGRCGEYSGALPAIAQILGVSGSCSSV
jgi:hypothetical protein